MWAFASIVGVTLVASLFQRWPFNVRLLLFAAPMTLLMIGCALDFVSQRLRSPAVALLAASMLLGPVIATNDIVDSIGVPTGARAAAAAISSRAQPGDVVYGYYLAYGEARFYQMVGVFPDVPLIEGVNLLDEDWSAAERQLDELDPAARVWTVFANVRRSGYDEQQAILSHLSRQREELWRASDHVRLFGPVSR